MNRNVASEQVGLLRAQISKGEELRYLFADRQTLVADDERINRVSGENLLPFSDVSALFRTFDMLEPIAELSQERHRLWAPDLVKPSSFTAISPWVMAGDPCVAQTRIPTAAIHALRIERGLGSADIVELYPGLTFEAAEDAHLLERRLRGADLPAASAA